MQSLMLREGVGMTTAKICVVEPGEAVEITEAVSGEQPGKYRVHVVATEEGGCRTREHDYALLPQGQQVHSALFSALFLALFLALFSA